MTTSSLGAAQTAAGLYSTGELEVTELQADLDRFAVLLGEQELEQQ